MDSHACRFDAFGPLAMNSDAFSGGAKKHMKVLSLGVCFFAIALTCSAQQSPPKYVIGASLIGPGPSCPGDPVFIGSVQKVSPASAAGILAGDQLVAIDGKQVDGFKDATHRLPSDSPSPVKLELIRDGSHREFTVQRENFDSVLARNGTRMLGDGRLVAFDSTDAEIQELRDITNALGSATDRFTVFPGHYPPDKSLYYPGFEVFVWDKGSQVRVGGIEDGPASQSGVRWGDKIVSVNGVDPRGKALAELESLLSSTKPTHMELVVERAGVRKSFSFELAKAEAVLIDNHWRVVGGELVPSWVPEKYIPCFQ